MPATYEPIATTTLGSSATSYTFTSIPSTYTDLVLISNVLVTSGSGGDLFMQYNSDTASNYSSVRLYGTGSTTGSDAPSSTPAIYYVGRGSSTRPCPNISSILNYSNTTTYKTSLHRANDAGDIVLAVVGSWRSTAAISSIKIFPSSGSFDTGSTFTLYGIKAA